MAKIGTKPRLGFVTSCGKTFSSTRKSVVVVFFQPQDFLQAVKLFFFAQTDRLKYYIIF